MKGTFNFDFDQKSLNHFEAQCEAAIRNIGKGSKKAQLPLVKKSLAIVWLKYQQIPTHCL